MPKYGNLDIPTKGQETVGPIWYWSGVDASTDGGASHPNLDPALFTTDKELVAETQFIYFSSSVLGGLGSVFQTLPVGTHIFLTNESGGLIIFKLVSVFLLGNPPLPIWTQVTFKHSQGDDKGIYWSGLYAVNFLAPNIPVIPPEKLTDSQETVILYPEGKESSKGKLVTSNIIVDIVASSGRRPLLEGDIMIFYPVASEPHEMRLDEDIRIATGVGVTFPLVISGNWRFVFIYNGTYWALIRAVSW